jgi:amino acid transporter
MLGKAKKFGAFGGVFTPSLLSILGVIMFLRLPWIVGMAGLWSTLGIILVAHIISVSTGLSISSLATDKRVETGGAYYIISRSLGLPIGGTLGLALFVGFSFSISLYLIGFSETFLTYFGFDVSLYAIRVTGSIILLLVAIITFISTSLAIRVQYLIMVIMVLSLISVFAGSHDFAPVASSSQPMADSLPWIVLFAIFFPAVTGFNTGVSMSGDLKDPRKDIPLGTMMAIFVGLIIYTGLAFFLSYTVDRNALVNDPQVLFHVSWVPQLVVAGIFSATLSSALGSILGAPRILRAVAIDRILPGFFSRGYGPSSEPRNALIITYMIAQAGILIGELNVIARIVSIFFIITYGFLNITYVIESWAGSDFRPFFKIPRFVGFIGALACIIVMIQLDVIALLVASVVLIILFLFLKRKELTLQSGDTWTGVWSSLVKTGLGRLSTGNQHVKNWRPNVMLFSGGEKNRPHLVEMGKSLVGKMGVFTSFELTEQPSGDILFGLKETRPQNTPMSEKGVFTRKHTCRDIYEGIDVISRVYGFAGFEPNTILMGWGKNTRNPEKFAALLASLKRQDYNGVFLSYDKDKGFGSHGSIDFWWSGKGRGLSLVLALLKFLTSSNQWRAAKIRILVIHKDSSKTDTLYGLINQLLDHHRLIAEVKVVNNAVEQLPEEKIISSESHNTDLTILELPEFNLKEPASVMGKANSLTECVASSVLISPSSFFDTVNVVDDVIDIVELPSSPGDRPDFDVIRHLRPASREIIANEVQNIAQTASRLAEKYFEQGNERILKLDLRFFPELHNFTLKTLDTLQRSVENGKSADQAKTILVILNDFSFHSRRHMQMLRKQRVTSIKNFLEEANLKYLDELRAMINVMPEYIRIKLNNKEFSIKKHDRFKTRIYKMQKKILAIITRRPVTHKIKVIPLARFFLYHKRLQKLHLLMTNFALHSFMEVVEIGKLFNAVHELIEKVRREPGNKVRNLDIIKLERSRLMAKIDVMENDSREFHYKSGQAMYEGLLHDLQQFSHHLESTGANIKSRDFDPQFRDDPVLVEEVSSFPGTWEKNLSLFINKAVLDFYILSLKNRIHSKINKFHFDFNASLTNGLIRELDAYQEFAGQLLSKPVKEALVKSPRLDHGHLKAMPVMETYRGLYSEIGELLVDIPEKMEVTAEQLGEKFRDKAFSEAVWLSVSLRKTVEYYISKELIDYTNKHCNDAEQMLKQHVAGIKDMVRLLNFSLDNQGKDDAAGEQAYRDQQSLELIKDFAGKLDAEKQKIKAVAENVEKAFETGLKRSFEPLSSATISKTSLVVRKRSREAEQAEFSGNLQRQWQRAKEITRTRFVDLLYSKSEGQLWVSHFGKEEASVSRSNKELLTFAGAVTPDENILKELPFYYASLFSGQSGTGDDFWVGMEHEMRESELAVQRFKAGYQGALVITGARSSGKSSLSKRVAERFFTRENIHAVQAPQACSADTEIFTRKLLDALNVRNKRIEDVFRALPAGKVIIIHDLGLWWERRPGGEAVVEMILKLIDDFSHKCLFIINVNAYALKVIDWHSRLSSYALAMVNCEAFDARELKDMIMLRHNAGGMNFRYNGKDEERMTAWDFARLFNVLFELSFGNPGTATKLWLSAIRKVSGKTIIMAPLNLPDKKVFDTLSAGQWFYVLQFLHNRRFTVARLAHNLEKPEDEVLEDIRELVRAGILVERFENVYSIRPGLDLYLAEQLKTRKRL